MRLQFLGFGLFSLLAAVPATASEYKTLPGSTLGFSGSFQGEPFAGNFARFSPKISFDPAKLAGSRFDVSIDLASADLRNEEWNDGLQSADFFNSGKQAQARFVATKFRALGGGRFVADGTLTLRGVARPVALTFTWTAGARPVLAGEAQVKRLDFGIGAGDWSATDELPNAVRVRTRLLLAPSAAPPK